MKKFNSGSDKSKLFRSLHDSIRKTRLNLLTLMSWLVILTDFDIIQWCMYVAWTMGIGILLNVFKLTECWKLHYHLFNLTGAFNILNVGCYYRNFMFTFLSLSQGSASSNGNVQGSSTNSRHDRMQQPEVFLTICRFVMYFRLQA